MAQNVDNKSITSAGNEPNGIDTPVLRDRASDTHARVRSARAEPIDAIVLAGTHQNPRRLVNGRNKAFLEIDGRALVRHVIDALVGAEFIHNIHVVGPRLELQEVLSGCENTHCVQQEGKMLSNSWAGIRATEAHYPDMPEDELYDRPVLIISCDLPLISPRGIDDFIIRAAQIDLDSECRNALVIGVAEEQGLKPFYGDSRDPGIVRPMVHLSNGLMRLANIYVARPRRLSHSEFLQTSFSYRKAKDWRNVLKLVFSLFRQHGGWEAAWITARLQLAAMLSGGQGAFYNKLRAGNTIKRINKGMSVVIGGPVQTVVTPFGGLSLDVDDEEDYSLLSRHYPQWMEITNNTVISETTKGQARTQ